MTLSVVTINGSNTLCSLQRGKEEMLSPSVSWLQMGSFTCNVSRKKCRKYLENSTTDVPIARLKILPKLAHVKRKDTVMRTVRSKDGRSTNSITNKLLVVEVNMRNLWLHSLPLRKELTILTFLFHKVKVQFEVYSCKAGA